MNLKVNRRYFIVISLLSFFLIGLFVLNNLEAFENQPKKTLDNNAENSQTQAEPIRKSTYTEISPDGSKKITRYKLDYNSSLFGGDHTTYLDNNIIISVTNIFPDSEREYYIFIGEERTGNPYWLSNNYVFFTNHCGSSCQGLTLLDVRNGQRWPAIISSLSDKAGLPETYFHDWFGRDFEFSGTIQRIHGLMEDNQPYLVFDMENKKGVEMGEKRFLFTGNSLILKN